MTLFDCRCTSRWWVSGSQRRRRGRRKEPDDRLALLSPPGTRVTSFPILADKHWTTMRRCVEPNVFGRLFTVELPDIRRTIPLNLHMKLITVIFLLQSIILSSVTMATEQTTITDGTGSASSATVHVSVVQVGEAVTLPCDVRINECGPAHSIKWYKNDQRVYLYSEVGHLDRAEGDMLAAGSRVTFVANVTPPYFHLQYTEISDDAQYRCEVTYLKVQDNCPIVTLLNLTVLDIPTLPEIRLNGQHLRNDSRLGARLEGERLNVSCVSKQSRPAAQVSWWLGDMQLFPSAPGKQTDNQHYHVYEQVTLEKDLRYTTVTFLELIIKREHVANNKVECRVIHPTIGHPHHYYSTWFYLDVRVRPSSVVLIGPKHPLVAGTKVSLSCVVDGSKPAANITWLNGTSALSAMPHAEVTTNNMGTHRTESRVTFNLTRFEHLANISCQATNSVLRTRNEPPVIQSTILSVLYAPIARIIPGGNVTVKEEESLLLTCDYVSNPINLTRVFWLKGSEPLIITDNHVMDELAGRPRLLIQNVSRRDQGVYQCSLENVAGSGISGKANIGIQHPPEVAIFISPAIVNETSAVRVHLRCELIRGNPYHLDSVKWYKDGKLLAETNVGDHYQSHVSRQHHGDYSCKAHNIAGWGVVSQAKNLVVNYAPGQSYLTYTPKVVVKRESLSLLCTVDDLGRPPVSYYRWTRGNRVIKEVTSGNWTIDPVTLSTEGNFTCVGINEVGSGKPASTFIDVHAPPTFIDRLPHYQGVSVTTTSLSMTCRVECDPVCHVQWLRNDLLIEPSQYYSITWSTLPADPSTDDFQSANSTLTWNLRAWPNGQLDRLHDNANFTCRSTDNVVGPGVSSTAYFRVEYPPENISIWPPTLDVVEGEPSTGKLRCKAMAYPESNYVWQLGDKLVGQGDVFLLTGILSRDRGGEYACIASNGRGNATSSAFVNVRYKPDCRIIDQSSKGKIRLFCKAEANPMQVHFTWTFGNATLADHVVDVRKGQSVLTIPNSPYNVGTYFCVANNSVGTSTPCSFVISGWAAETQGWLEKLGDDSWLVICLVVGGITLVVMVLCCVIVMVAKRRRSRRKYHEGVELEERENADGQSQFPDGSGPGRPVSLNPNILPPNKYNGQQEIRIPDGGVPTLYRQLCPGVLLPYQKGDGNKDGGHYVITNRIADHDIVNKRET
ncbi:hypothetical protein CHUAL_002351 [Chamberlinius hualienensis]